MILVFLPTGERVYRAGLTANIASIIQMKSGNVGTPVCEAKFFTHLKQATSNVQLKTIDTF